MAVAKIDPKVIFASEAPAQDTPAVFTNKTVGWGESRKNGGRPTIKQSNALQQETDLKILWLNENSVTPFDATIDYPENAVTIKDGVFKILKLGVWELFLDKSSVGLSNVDNTSDLNKPVSTAVQTALNLKADKSTTYTKTEVDNAIDLLKPPYLASDVTDGNQIQDQINLYGAKTYDMPAGGYPVGGLVRLDNGDIVKSTVDGNANNPNVDMMGWELPQARDIFDVSGKTQQEINDGLESIVDLLSIPSTVNGSRVYVKSYHAGLGKGGGFFVYRSGVARNRHNGITIIDPTKTWDGSKDGLVYVAATTSYPTTSAFNPSVADKKPILGGFLGHSSSAENGCWVREDNQISFCNAGCYGDADFEVDGTDDSLMMIAAVNALPKKNGNLLIEPYYYTHGSGALDSKSNIIYFEANKRLTINADGAVIQSHSGNLPLPQNAILRFGRGCKSVTINDLELDGRLDVRTALGGDSGSLNQLSNIAIEDGCHRFQFNRVISNRAAMDGLTVGIGGIAASVSNLCEDIVLTDCHMDRNYRQGISLLRSIGFKMYGGSLTNTGVLKGTSPMAGFDAEAEGSQYGYDTYNEGVVLSGVRITGNKGAGVWLHNDSLHCQVLGCFIKDNDSYGVAVYTNSKNNTITGNILSGNGSVGVDGAELYDFGMNTIFTKNFVSVKGSRALLSLPNTEIGATIKDNLFTNETTAQNSRGYIVVRNVISYSNNKHYNLCPSASVYTVEVEGVSGQVSGNKFTKTFESTHRCIRISTGSLVEFSNNSANEKYQNFDAATVFSTGGSAVQIDVVANNSVKGLIGGRYIGTKNTGVLSNIQNALGNKSSVSAGVPTSGTYMSGDLVADSNGTGVWLCNVRGTMGAISGVTASGTVGSPKITVSTVAGLYAGAILNIPAAGLSGTTLAAIDGLTITLGNNVITTFNDGVVNYKPATFKFIAAT